MIVKVTGYSACCQYCKRYIDMSTEEFKLYSYRLHRFVPSKVFSKESQCKSSIVHNIGKSSGWIYEKNNDYKITCQTCLEILIEQGEIDAPKKDSFGNYVFN